jgi:hypothetical protein
MSIFFKIVKKNFFKNLLRKKKPENLNLKNYEDYLNIRKERKKKYFLYIFNSLMGFVFIYIVYEIYHMRKNLKQVLDKADKHKTSDELFEKYQLDSLAALIKDVPYALMKICTTEDEYISDLYNNLRSYLLAEKQEYLDYRILRPDKLSQKQLKQIENILGFKDGLKELKSVLFIVVADGRAIPIYKDDQEIQNKIANILNGINSVEYGQLKENFEKFTDETVHILYKKRPGSNLSEAVEKFFYENNHNFGNLTFNFLNNIDAMEQDDDELKIVVNPKYYNIDNNNSSKDLKDIKDYKVFMVKFDKNKSVDKLFEDEFVNVILYMINPNKTADNKLSLKYNLPKRISYTNNPYLAKYFKLSFLEDKQHFLFIYTDRYEQELVNIIKTSKIPFLMTENPDIADIFNIVPDERLPYSIRYVDYSKYVKYDDKLSGSYQFIQPKDVRFIAKKDLLFSYKANFTERPVTKETLNAFIDKAEKYEFKSYLESLPVYPVQTQVNKITEIVGSNFKDFLNIKGRKILYCCFKICNGCKTAEMYLNSSNFADAKVFKYDIRNESIYFKKLSKVPYIFIFDGDKLIREIDISSYLTTHEEFNKAIKNNLNI